MTRLSRSRERAKNPVSRYLDELIDFGGEPFTRAEVISTMQRSGTPQPLIDRWLQGQELAAQRQRNRSLPKVVLCRFRNALTLLQSRSHELFLPTHRHASARG